MRGNVLKRLIIIPAYNEAENIVKTVEAIKEKAKGFDYIIINDCSTDRMKNICEENGYNVINVATGLATRIINIEIDTDIPIMLMNFDGNDNRPNIKNKTICIIQEIQSKN